MYQKRIAFFAFIAGILISWSFQAPAQESIGAAAEGIEEAQNPQLAAEDAIAPLSVKEEDGRTVLMTDTVDKDTKVTLSFSNIKDQVQAHVDVASHGLKYRYTLVQPKGKNNTPIVLELEGPAFKEGPGIRLKIRF